MQKMRRKKLFGLVLCFITIGSSRDAHTQSNSHLTEGSQQFASFGEFKLNNGITIHDFRLGYRTLGKLNASKSNAVLWPTWLGGRSQDLLTFVGPANVVDTNSYFVILVDSIGNGVSTSPSNSSLQPLMKFPQFTVRDMVESERRLLTETLHLSHLHAVMGISMGGMQTFEWAVAYPDFMDLAVSMSGSPQSTSSDKLLWTSEIDAIELDPAWNKGKPTGSLTRGIALAEEIDEMNLTSPGYRTNHTNTDEFESFLAGIRDGAKGGAGSAADQIRQRQAILSLNITAEFHMSLGQAAKQLHAKLLVVISPQDHMVNPGPAVEFASTIGAPIVRLDSLCGHQSYTCVSTGPTVAQFLANPSSIQDETLTESLNH